MPLNMTCPGCQADFDVPDAVRGKTIRCTACRAEMKVPPAKPVAAKPLSLDEDDEDDRPRRPRMKADGSNVGLMAVLGLLGLLLVGGAGYGIYSARKGGAKTAAPSPEPSRTAGTNTPPAAPPRLSGDGGTAAVAAGWRLITGSGYTIRMPVQPEPVVLGIGSDMKAARIERDKEIYVVMSIPVAGLNVADPTDARAAMAAFHQQEAARGDGTVGEPTDITQDGFPGQEFTKVPARGGHGQSRVVVVGDRIILAGAGGTALTPGDARIRTFFDSFHITAKPPTGSPRPAGPVAGDWQPVADAEWFTAEMPGKGKRISGNPGGRGEWAAETRETNGVKGLFWIEVGQCLAPADEKDLLAYIPERDPLVAHGGSPILNLRNSYYWAAKPSDITLGGVRGKQYAYRDEKGTGSPVGVARVFVRGRRFYRVFAAGPGFSATEPRVKRFLESFRFAGPVVTNDDWWQPVVQPLGFTVEMPDEAATSTAGSEGYWEYKNGSELFRVESNRIGRFRPAEALDFEVKELRFRKPWGLFNDAKREGEPTDITRDGHPGKEVIFTSEDGKNRAVYRVYATNTSVFTLLVSGPGHSPTAARTLRFLDSFKITAKPAAPRPAAPPP